MSIEISTLRNGLRVVSHEMPHLETTSLGIWIGAGARDESEDENGISHLLEHMAFKGTKTRSARDIAEEIETVGGELNAATGPESTGYFARVLAGANDDNAAGDLAFAVQFSDAAAHFGAELHPGDIAQANRYPARA